MKEHTQLKEIADIYLEEVVDYLKLSKATKAYKELLLTLSGLDMDEEAGRNNIHFDIGKALGTTWAAMCVDDMMRTKRFIKGLFEAVQQRRTEKKGAVHILYAGTGPFATLALPLLVHFSAKEIQLTLLEINPGSFASVQKVISRLGFDSYITAFENGDATQYKINNAGSFDILLSETMQHALQKEQQVPIVLHLLQQLPEHIILIPERIDLELCLMRCDNMPENNTETARVKRLGKIIELSKASANTFYGRDKKNNNFSFSERSISITTDSIGQYRHLAILTDILVYGNEKINFNESSLTMPYILEDISRREQKDICIQLQYKINETPGVFYTISKTAFSK